MNLGRLPLVVAFASAPISVLAAGCERSPPGSPEGRAVGGGPNVTVLDSVLLGETDAFYVGQPSSLAIDPLDGSFYIADGFSARAYRFARDGAPVRTYGTPGEGPGEVRDTRSALLVGDSLVAVDDFRERTMELYDRDTGDFRGRQEHGGVSGGQVHYSDDRDTVWLAWPEFPGGGHAVSEWVPTAGTLRGLSPVPDVYRTNPAYFAMSGLTASLAAFEDGFLLGYGSLPRVYLVSRDGEVTDSLRPPVVRRRRIPDNILEIATSASEAEKRAAISVLLRMQRRSDGQVLLVHSDPMLSGEFPAVEIWARYYVSLLTPDLGSGCMDQPLALGERTHAIFLPHADTLFALTQRVIEGETVEAAPRAETWVTSWLVDDTGCAWIDTGFRPAGIRDSVR